MQRGVEIREFIGIGLEPLELVFVSMSRNGSFSGKVAGRVETGSTSGRTDPCHEISIVMELIDVQQLRPNGNNDRLIEKYKQKLETIRAGRQP
ncbi:hypothetical protein Rleg10DRAFT_5783 [Rhizobium leguminosarum bv. trifolii WSM2012]|nr:hypothetical protein Rleg10DRAFT_4203 [Rhizobium leguminosarum bv. trifolii WSM2012]EJC77089.1 hypothetical protein Rleg10DRAFT_5783 [Rhizobium leguminosarum bv. trifolii WSM2012]